MAAEKGYSFSTLGTHLERFKNALRIAVVYGGDKNNPGSVIFKSHNPRPWKSYQTVAEDIRNTLLALGFCHVITMPDDLDFLANLKKENIQFVWLNTGGVQGYIPMAHAAAMLEMAGIPYIGHNPQNAALLDNKHIFKTMLQKFGIDTSPFVVWSRSALESSRKADLSNLRSVFGGYRGPFIIKPTSGRASLHVTYVPDLDGLFEAVKEVYDSTQNLIVIERYFPGKEYCVSVCGPVTVCGGKPRKAGAPFVFSVLERLMDKDELIFTSMDKKPITNERARVLKNGADTRVCERLRRIARQIYGSFFLETLVRIDIRDDGEGNFYVLEANPKPDLKKPSENVTSLTCIGLSEEGMTYDDLILSLLSDRLDYLLTYRSNNVRHLAELLE